MKISILTENKAGGKFFAEHGLSYLIEIDGEQILFDTGQSDIFLKNAELLNFDIHKDVQKVILSHGHWDHGNGLQHLNNKTLITHPNSFISRYRKASHTSVGLAFTKKEIEKKFRLIETKTPHQLTEHLFFLGEIPRLTNFESKTTSFELEDKTDDFIEDDSALFAVVNNKLIVITACSHSGICNICEQAKLVSGIQNINTVIGGFHLKTQNVQTQLTIEYFKKNAVKRLLPSRCTDLPVLAAFYNEFKIAEVKTGKVFEF